MAGGFGPDLTQFRVMVPTRRAARELRETFLSLSDNKPLLLPRIHPLGDINQEELELLLSGTVGSEAVETLPPALSSLERQMILTRLVQAADPERRGEQSLSLARALGSMMDQVYAEDLDLADLPNAVDIAELSDHWSRTVEFLKILSIEWPRILLEKGAIDAADRRNRLIKMLAHYWSINPPQTPVIVAGAMGTVPASRRLLHVVANLPKGHVVLPGLDQDMDDEAWNNVTETHPQNMMKQLLHFMEAERSQVSIWRKNRFGASARAELAAAITCPAESCDRFEFETRKLEQATESLHLVEAENPRHEAQLIALAIRETLEDPVKTAIIVTPDRNLARRISGALRRWDIAVDDSAGQPLHMRPIGIFFGRILNAMLEDLAPVELLDLLKSPYLADRYTPGDIADFETALLRGPRPAAGFTGLQTRIQNLEDADLRTRCLTLLENLQSNLSPLLGLDKSSHDFASFIKASVMAAENLAGGREAVWKSADGYELSQLLSKLQDISGNLIAADLWTSRSYLMQFMSECMLRPAYGTHPRVTILGLIEARLMRADVMILAGLNEGTWPLEPEADPWMSRPMRGRFGLPPKARETGISAHDFIHSFCADTVIMTRSKRVDGAPTSRTRWLQRLSAILKGAGRDLSELEEKNRNQWSQWLSHLDSSTEFAPIKAPEPRPPLSARPRELSVTQVETLMKNPYQIYASKILKLRPLPPIDEDVTASERGSFVHDILNEFTKSYPDHLPADSRSILLDMGQKRLQELEQVSPLWHYWWPRFELMAEHYIATEKNWRMDAMPQAQEIKGRHSFDYNGQVFTLTARADRIDRIKTGGAAIIDYKTGNKPSLKNIGAGRAPQLPLEALLITKGGFASIVSKPENIALSYWVLTGKDAQPVERYDLDSSRKLPPVAQLVKEAESGLEILMTAYLNELTPFTATIPASNRLYEDEKAYKHLARTDEWGIEGDAEQHEEAA